MTLATARHSVSHLPEDGDLTVIISYRRGDPIGLTLVEIENGDHLSPDEHAAILREADERLRVNIAGFEAEMGYDRDGRVGFRLNGWTCCAACFLTQFCGDAAGIVYPRGIGAPIHDVEPLYKQRITCYLCGQTQPWQPRVIHGGRES